MITEGKDGGRVGLIRLKLYRTRAYLLAIDFDVGDIVLEDSRHIDLWELVFAKDDQKASFTAGTIADNYQFLANRRHWRFWNWQRERAEMQRQRRRRRRRRWTMRCV